MRLNDDDDDEHLFERELRHSTSCPRKPKFDETSQPKEESPGVTADTCEQAGLILELGIV